MHQQQADKARFKVTSPTLTSRLSATAAAKATAAAAAAAYDANVQSLSHIAKTNSYLILDSSD
jgi:hypothetical protein